MLIVCNSVQSMYEIYIYIRSHSCSEKNTLTPRVLLVIVKPWHQHNLVSTGVAAKGIECKLVVQRQRTPEEAFK